MSLSIDFESLTVEGYRQSVADVIALQPHAAAIAELKERYPTIRPVQLVTAYLLSQGEDLRKACVFAGITPFLFKEVWIQHPEFKLLITDLSPVHTTEAEGFKLNSKEQHHIIWREMALRALNDIEAAKNVIPEDGKYDPMLQSGLLLSRTKTVGKTTTREVYANPAFRILERAMQAAGELESLYKPRQDEITDEMASRGVQKMVIGRAPQAVDQAARDAAIQNN